MSSKEKLGEVVALWPTTMKLRMIDQKGEGVQASFVPERIITQTMT